MLQFSGCLIPLITPFTDDMSSVSEVRLARMVRRLVQEGAQGFMVGGDAGEFGTLSHAERKFVLEIVIRESQNSVPVIMNATALSTMSALDLAQHAARHGSRAVTIIPPYYGRYTIEEIQHHLKTIANYAPIPVLLVTQPDLHPPELIDQVLRHQGILHVQPLSKIWDSATCSSPYATTDEFSIHDVTVSPLGLFEPTIGKSGPPAVTESRKFMAAAMRKHGPTRVCKGLLDLEDCQIGPPRTPMQPLEREVIQEIFQKQSAA